MNSWSFPANQGQEATDKCKCEIIPKDSQAKPFVPKKKKTHQLFFPLDRN